MGNRIYVGNLSYGTNDDGLRQVFEENGYKVSDVHVVTDRETGRSRGFAFVEVEDPDALSSAISSLDGREVDGRRLALSEARPRQPREGGGGGGGPSRGDRPDRPSGGGGRFNNDRRPPVQERRRPYGGGSAGAPAGAPAADRPRRSFADAGPPGGPPDELAQPQGRASKRRKKWDNKDRGPSSESSAQPGGGDKRGGNNRRAGNRKRRGWDDEGDW